MTKKPAKKAAKKTVKKPAKKAVKKAVKKTVKKPATKSAVKKTAKKTVKKTATKTVKKTAAEAGKKTAKKPVKTDQTPAATKTPTGHVAQRAYGSYDGVQLCENPKFFPEKSPYSDKDLDAIKNLLKTQRKRLLEILRELDEKTFQTTTENGKGLQPSSTTHLFEGASENIETETALLVRRDEEDLLTQVDAALERLESGLFGVCIACASKLGMPRLRAKPEAHLCITCKIIYDKHSSRR